MNCLGVLTLMFGIISRTGNANAQHRDSAPNYLYSSAGRPTSQETAVPPLYSKSLQAVLAKSGPSLQQDYSSQHPAAPGLTASQNYYQEQAEPQRAAYTQQSATKYVSSAPSDSQKYSYSAQPQYQQTQYQQPQYQQPPQYSSAADVSSFSYTSPVVSYNNQGLLKQLAGKTTTPSHGKPVVYNSGSSVSQPKYQSPSNVQYVPETSNAYTSSQSAYSSPSTSNAYSLNALPSAQSAYPSSAAETQNAYYPQASVPTQYTQTRNTYSEPSSPNVVYSRPQTNYIANRYQQLPQKSLTTLSAESPSASYQPGVEAQKYSFLQSSGADYQVAKSPQAAYVQPSAQQYSSSQQAAQSSPYETASQFSPQYVYTQQSSGYSAAPQSKYSKSGITYA